MADNVIVRVPEQQFIRGEDGYSPEVTIENIDHGHRITITDREHPEGQTADVLDGDSAYEQAVAGGYTGTEAQFNEELASFKELSEQAADSAAAAAQSESNADASAQDSEAYAIGKRNGVDVGAGDPASNNNSKYYMELAAHCMAEADSSETAATSSMRNARNYASSAQDYAGQATSSASAAATAKTAAEAAQTAAAASASDASDSADSAASSATAASGSATAAASSATAAGNAQTAAETAQSAAEDAQEAAEAVLASIPSDYTELTEDVDDLKSAINPSSIRSINKFGVYTEAPEQSIASYKKAIETGFNILLCDMRFTSDGYAVCMHDATINRIARNADGSKITEDYAVSTHTLAELNQFDYGIYKGAKYADTKILLLDDFIKFCKYTGAEAYVELYGTASEASIANAVNIVANHAMIPYTTWCISINARTRADWILNNNINCRLAMMPAANDWGISNTFKTAISELKARTDKVCVFGWTTDYITDADLAWFSSNNVAYEVGECITDADMRNYINNYFVIGIEHKNTYINNGEIVSYNGWGTSQKMYCEGLTQIIGTFTSKYGTYNAFFDANDNYIPPMFTIGQTETVVNVPENAKYFRVSQSNATITNFSIRSAKNRDIVSGIESRNVIAGAIAKEIAMS